MYAAALLCVTWWIVALYAASSGQPLSPDSAHSAVVARNIVLGRGNTIDWVPVHFGLRETIHGAPEWHGLLRAPVLAALFYVFGVHDQLIAVPGLTYVAATAMVAFLFAYTVFGSGAAWLACLMTLSSAGLRSYGWRGTDDTDFAFFFLLTMFFAYLGLQRDGRFIAWAGLAGALALLAKQTGLYLAGLYLVVLWLGRGRGAGWRWVAWMFVPFLAAFSLYLLRNYAAHGGFMFRLGALNWLLKAQGLAVLHAVYTSPPHLGDVLRELGPGGVLAIVGEQFQRLAREVFVPSWRAQGGLNLLALGFLSLALHARWSPTFVWLSSLSIAGGIAFICGLYSVEPRYFLMFVPLAAVSLGGTITKLPARPAVAVAAVVVVAYAVHYNVHVGHFGGRALDHRRLCPPTFVEWIDQNLPADDVIMARNPSFVSWLTHRPAVVLSRGKPRDLALIVDHYGVEWYWVDGNSARMSAPVLRKLRRAGFVVSPAITEKACTMYSIRRRGRHSM